MSLEEALKIIKQACASVQGDLAVHSKIQEAVRLIEGRLLPPKKTKR